MNRQAAASGFEVHQPWGCLSLWVRTEALYGTVEYEVRQDGLSLTELREQEEQVRMTGANRDP